MKRILLACIAAAFTVTAVSAIAHHEHRIAGPQQPTLTAQTGWPPPPCPPACVDPKKGTRTKK